MCGGWSGDGGFDRVGESKAVDPPPPIILNFWYWFPANTVPLYREALSGCVPLFLSSLSSRGHHAKVRFVIVGHVLVLLMGLQASTSRLRRLRSGFMLLL